MAAVVFRGKAAVEGVAGAIDVIVYPLRQTMKLTQNYTEEIIQDEHGYDAAWLLRNEHTTLDIGVRLLGDTAAHAASGSAFLAPQATIVLSTFTVSAFNGTFHLLPGSSLGLANDKAGDGEFKMRKYADATQNTAAVTTPS